MAKYKIGDKVRIVSEMPCDSDFTLDMRRFLGKEITISMAKEWDGVPRYYSEDAKPMSLIAEGLFAVLGVPGYYFRENWISGLAEPQKPADDGLSVVIRFHGNLTVAELYKNGKVVKVENARCNPSDTFNRGEGAKVAVNRLFAKKEKAKKEKATEKPDLNGHMFVVTGDCPRPSHFFPIGEKVLRVGAGDSVIPGISEYVSIRTGLKQAVYDRDVKPV